jgi:octaprenyl-diphosphate synthase
MPESGNVNGLAEKMESYGRCLGQAFQIVDDLLDVVGEEAEAGKSLGTDLEHQKATLPLIHLWQQVGDTQRGELREIMQGPSENRAARLGPLLSEHRSIEYARERALDFASQAGQCLRGLPSNPAAEMLTRLPEFVLQRSR